MDQTNSMAHHFPPPYFAYNDYKVSRHFKANFLILLSKKDRKYPHHPPAVPLHMLPYTAVKCPQISFSPLRIIEASRDNLMDWLNISNEESTYVLAL